MKLVSQRPIDDVNNVDMELNTCDRMFKRSWQHRGRSPIITIKIPESRQGDKCEKETQSNAIRIMVDIS